jgi:hypothetical protein
MPFGYYRRLTRAQQRIYRSSDEISNIRLRNHAAFADIVDAIANALASEDRRMTENACQMLASSISSSLKVPAVHVEVLAARPARRWGELHGLYTPRRIRRPCVITIWMRTAKRRQVVAFRTFLRTFIHELCHHLDYELLGLQESFHTEGFYKRESSLFHQLVSVNSYDNVRRE